jgi:predicted AlkP superfamily pyrophosphatase or phosphodiesterase
MAGLKSRDIFNKVDIMLVSDHGMASIHPDSIIYLDDYIKMDDVYMVDWTPISSISPLKNVDEIYSKLKNIHPNMSVYKKGDAPERYHYRNHRRIQPVTAVAHEHWSISTHEYSATDDHAEDFNGATHGYDPAYPSMRGIFVGHGPAFKSGFNGPGITNIHLYEMMCSMLGLSPAENDGSLDSSRVFLVN